MKRRTLFAGVPGSIALTAGCTGTLGRSSDAERGTVRFYVSDEPNRIGDFRTLDVTISSVALKPASEDDEDDANGNESETDDDAATDDGAGMENRDGNESTQRTDDGTDSTDTADDETAADGANDGDGGDALEDGRGIWDEHDLDDPTVDLTQLKGPKATVLDELDAPAGEYVAVDMFVADVHAVLTDGTETTLKIPSERLKIRTPFTVAADDELDFVYDIAPKKAGGSGKYILTPVIGESGTDAEIDAVDAKKSGNVSA